MSNSKTRWVRGMGAVVLVGGLMITGWGLGVASAAPAVRDDPHTGLTPNWDENLPSASRFTVLTAFASAAVRDNNTGLVWEKVPDPSGLPWAGATIHCVRRSVGGTVGWRLPSVVELSSVRDPSLPAPFVPAVFTGFQSAYYWSATTNAAFPSDAWIMGFTNGDVNHSDKSQTLRVWCVRGGMNADAY